MSDTFAWQAGHLPQKVTVGPLKQLRERPKILAKLSSTYLNSLPMTSSEDPLTFTVDDRVYIAYVVEFFRFMREQNLLWGVLL